MQIVPATPGDVETLVELVNRAYRGISAEAGWTHEAGLLDGQRTDAAMLGEQVGGDRSVILLLRDHAGGPLVGCVSVERTAEPDTWYLGMLTIDPAKQAGGLGRILLDGAEAYMRRQGARRARLTVIHLRAALIAWYERRGYRLTGASEAFPYGNERFGVPLRPDLRLDVMEKALAP